MGSSYGSGGTVFLIIIVLVVLAVIGSFINIPLNIVSLNGGLPTLIPFAIILVICLIIFACMFNRSMKGVRL